MYKKFSILFILLLLTFTLSPISFFVVNGQSMNPTIPDGSLQLVNDTKDVGEGDIIVFLSTEEDKTIIHRIVDETKTGFITQGDNNNITDQERGLDSVSKDQIRGKAVEIADQPLFIPFLGSIILLMKQNLLLSTLLLVSGIILLFVFEIESVSRTTLTKQSVFTAAVAISISSMIILMLLATSTITFPFVFTESEASAQQQYTFLADGDQIEGKLTVEENKAPFTQILYSSDTLDIQKIEESDQYTEIYFEDTGSDEIGSRNEVVTAHVYPSFIPKFVLNPIFNISPILATILASIATSVPFYLVYILYIDRKMPVSIETRARLTKLQRLYEKYR